MFAFQSWFTIAFFYVFWRSVAGDMLPNFDVTRIETCGPEKGPIKLNYANVTKKNGNQYAHFDGITNIPIDDNVGFTSKIEYAPDRKLFMPLVTIRDRNTCKSGNQYLGEFWYDIERAANITPGACPIPAGHYHAQNVLLNFSKLPVQKVPFGTIKITINLLDNNNHNTLFCILIEVQSSSN